MATPAGRPALSSALDALPQLQRRTLDLGRVRAKRIEVLADRRRRADSRIRGQSSGRMWSRRDVGVGVMIRGLGDRLRLHQVIDDSIRAIGTGRIGRNRHQVEPGIRLEVRQEDRPGGEQAPVLCRRAARRRSAGTPRITMRPRASARGSGGRSDAGTDRPTRPGRGPSSSGPRDGPREPERPRGSPCPRRRQCGTGG